MESAPPKYVHVGEDVEYDQIEYQVTRAGEFYLVKALQIEEFSKLKWKNNWEVI